MERDAHYYAVLAFARGCGFKKDAALTIAHASQYVDDAKINHMVVKKELKDLPEYDEIKDGCTHFINMATCHQYEWLKTLNYSAMINNTCAFHFVPGCEDKHGDSFVRKLRCKASSAVVENILEEALDDEDLVKFGMVLHPYADTFTHQGFDGFLSKVNEIQNCRASGLPLDRKFMDLLPVRKLLRLMSEKYHISIFPYGHVFALTYPDMANIRWSYEYDDTERFTASKKEEYKKVSIDNIDRFRDAFKKIQQYLQRYLEKHDKYRDEKVVQKDFEELFRTFEVPTIIDEIKFFKWEYSWKEEKWQKFLVEQNLFDGADDHVIKYDESKWLKDIFNNCDDNMLNKRKVEGAWIKPEFSLESKFADTEWYRNYRAVKWYKKRFYHHCSENGLDIPNDYIDNVHGMG